MICKNCKWKDECGLYGNAQKISGIVENMITGDGGYSVRISKALNSLTECEAYEDEIEEQVSISKKEYDEFLEIKSAYENIKQLIGNL